MIEPIDQFGICWHCDNLMVSSHKSQMFVEYEPYIYWQATCTAMTLNNSASIFRNDEFAQDEYWHMSDSNNGWDFRKITQTCSKYKVLK